MRVGVALVHRLFQQMLVHHNHRVGAQHGVVRMPRKHGVSFVAGQTLRVVERLLVRQRLFAQVRRFHRESDVGIAQKFRTARRGGSQNERHASTILKPRRSFALAALGV